MARCHVSGRRWNRRNALQAAGFLQNQRSIAVRLHQHPTEAHRVHPAGLVEAVDRIEAVPLDKRGTNGGVSAFLCSNLDGPEGTQTCPITEGVITGTITAQEVVGPEDQGIGPGKFDELIRVILNKAAYVNVHTVDHPAGEIRGQIR